MAMGGFMGTDPILSPEKLARLVEDKQVRFVMVPDFSTTAQRMGVEAPGGPIVDWVRTHGAVVTPVLWRASAPEADANDPTRASIPRDPSTPQMPFGPGFGGRVNNSQLYDLRPEVGVVPAPLG